MIIAGGKNMKDKYSVNKDYVLGSISLKGLTVSQFCRDLGLNRTNFYIALSKSYSKPRSLVIGKVITALGLSESLVWTKGE